jgi:hypothetical protein
MYFSSSPGLLSSVDDFFTVNGLGQFMVTETSLDVFNAAILSLIKPGTMLSWMRARIANVMATSGSQWAEYFSQLHSGTYANQWMVLDYNRFTPHSAPHPGFFTVVEEIPGYIHYEDMTDILTHESYWASFNVPYFEDISMLTGFSQRCEEDVNNCHDSDPRARIFKEKQVSE